jgi:type VI secretion system protein ImpC
VTFRILVCGDFSGGALKTHPLLKLDVDNFDQSMRRLQARVPLVPATAESAGGELIVESLDDFHPDTLCRKVPSLQVLCELRRRLLDPRTASQTIHALTRDASPAAATTTTSAAAENDAAMLTRLLGSPEGRGAAAEATAMPALEAILQRAVAGHIAPATDPRQSTLVASVDHALAESMRRVLHSSPFQRLESAWRSIHWLVTNVGPDEELQIAAYDISKQALATDLSSPAAVGDSEIYRRIGEKFPCSLIVGDYAFGPNAEDMSLLTTLAALAQSLGAPFVGAADNALLNSESFDAFRALRRSAAASFVGLTWPRWMLRAPYGRKRDPVESFAFEELEGRPEPASLLWGNAAFATAAIVAEAFRDDGLADVPDQPFDIGDRPLYVFEEDGDSEMQPVGEWWISESAVEAALSQGVMPIVSLQGRNTVRLPRLQSIAESADPLSLPLAE